MSLQDSVVSLTYPPTLSAWLLACAGLGWWLRSRRLAAAIAAAAIAWSLVWSIPQASDWLRSGLESRYPVVADSALPRADAIVVLGGGNYSWLHRPGIRLDQLESSRIAAGARAWRNERAPIVILSGGGRPGDTEADTMAVAIAKFGVPASAVLLEEKSRNTADNARYTAVLAERHRIRGVLLVTSSLHMPRAMLQFRNAGIDATAVPVPERADRSRWRDRWLPSPSALWRSGRAFKEYIALLAAHLRN